MTTLTVWRYMDANAHCACICNSGKCFAYATNSDIFYFRAHLRCERSALILVTRVVWADEQNFACCQRTHTEDCSSPVTLFDNTRVYRISCSKCRYMRRTKINRSCPVNDCQEFRPVTSTHLSLSLSSLSISLSCQFHSALISYKFNVPSEPRIAASEKSQSTLVSTH